jgi:hypothetical protein
MAQGKNDEELEQLDAAIGMVEDPEEEAKRALREHQEAMGMHFDNPNAPVEADPNTLGDFPDEYIR